MNGSRPELILSVELHCPTCSSLKALLVPRSMVDASNEDLCELREQVDDSYVLICDRLDQLDETNACAPWTLAALPLEKVQDTLEFYGIEDWQFAYELEWFDGPSAFLLCENYWQITADLVDQCYRDTLIAQKIVLEKLMQSIGSAHEQD